MTIGSVLVDFDGTACPVDVTGELCEHFAAGDHRGAGVVAGGLETQDGAGGRSPSGRFPLELRAHAVSPS